MKNTKRSLLFSVLALILCCAMLAGTTLAWFTDSASSGINQIVAGNLDVALVDANGNNIEGNDQLFSTPELWEPGAVAVAQMKVANLGTLALKYNMSINYEDVNSLNGHVLSEVLQYAIITLAEDETPANLGREEILARAKASTNKGDLDSYSYTHNLNAGTEDALQTLVVFWDANSSEIDNLYNANNGKLTSDGNPLQINLGVKVEATQLKKESDSFGPDYDENAPTLITINGKNYATLAEALEAAEDNDTIKISGPVVMYASENANTEVDMKNVKIEGVEDAFLIFKNVDGNGNGGTGSFKNVNLKNLSVVDETFYNYENGENAWEFTYLEFSGTNTFENVIFTDGVMPEGDMSTFNGCTFIGHNNDSSDLGNTTMYGAWVTNGSASFTGCTFTGTRGLKVSEIYSADTNTVTVDSCTFDNLSEKPGVAIDIQNNGTANITIKNSEFVNCQPGDQGLYIYETDNVDPTLENNTVISEVSTADDLSAALNKTYNSDITIMLMNDITLSDEWGVHELNGSNNAELTIDGNGKTIYGLSSSNYYNAGGFNSNGLVTTIGAGFSSVTFKNLTVSGANLTNNGGESAATGVFVGDTNTVDVTFDTCTVTGATVNCYKWAGGFVGFTQDVYNNKTMTFTNCVVSDSTINTTDSSAGGLVGQNYIGLMISGCQIKGSTSIACAKDRTGTSAKAGYLVGTVSGGTTTIGSITVEPTVQLDTKGGTTYDTTKYVGRTAGTCTVSGVTANS